MAQPTSKESAGVSRGGHFDVGGGGQKEYFLMEDPFKGRIV